MGSLLTGLRHGFYALHVAIVLGAAYYIQTYVMVPEPFTFYALWGTALLHIISINFITFFAYGYDKKAARKGAWRIPEKTLQGFAFVGGTLGAIIGQKFFRHKTKKSSFQLLFWMIFFMQIMAVSFFAITTPMPTFFGHLKGAQPTLHALL